MPIEKISEQADAVQRVAHHPGGEQGEQDRGRDDHRDHHRLAPADGKRHQHHDRDRGKAEVKQQLVGLLIGGFSVVARNLDLQVGRHDRPMQLRHPLDHLFGDHDRIASGALGHRHRDRRNPPQPFPAAGDGGHAHFFWRRRQFDPRHVADIDRAAVARRQQQIADLAQALQRLAREQRNLPPALAHKAGLEGAVGALDLGGKLLQRDPISRQRLGIRLDADLLGLFADDIGQPDIVELGQFHP